jgi:hypothetical protein
MVTKMKNHKRECVTGDELNSAIDFACYQLGRSDNPVWGKIIRGIAEVNSLQIFKQQRNALRKAYKKIFNLYRTLLKERDYYRSRSQYYQKKYKELVVKVNNNYQYTEDDEKQDTKEKFLQRQNKLEL